MKKNSPKNSVISTGTVSVVLIFVLLCMLTFSVLSLVSAQANLRLSKKSADRTTAYYAAENEANDLLIRIEEAAVRVLSGRSVSSGGALAAALVQELGEGADVTAREDQLSYQVPLGEEQELSVVLTMFLMPDENGRHYRVDKWQAVSIHEWDGDDMPDLMNPGNLPE